MRIAQKCKIKFSISVIYVDEVECEVSPLNICGVMLGSPFLWDKDATFYRRKQSIAWSRFARHTSLNQIKRERERSQLL
jgi:hypothetical protein